MLTWLTAAASTQPFGFAVCCEAEALPRRQSCDHASGLCPSIVWRPDQKGKARNSLSAVSRRGKARFTQMASLSALFVLAVKKRSNTFVALTTSTELKKEGMETKTMI
jgi:hypothetical protein